MSEKCPKRTVKDVQEIGYDLNKGTMISIPPGTKFNIYVNVDSDDPTSDTWIEQVEITGSLDINAILTEATSVKEVE